MQYISLVIACALALPGGLHKDGPTLPSRTRALGISFLTVECSLQRKWVGLWQQLDEGVFINCGGDYVLVTHPNNKLGHVMIETPDQALEYVRLFTSADTYMFFQLNDMVELLPRDPHSADAAFNIVVPKVFDRLFRRARTRKVDDHPCKQGVELACGKEFEVRRMVVFTNGRVYEIVESVYEKGFYHVLSRRLVLKDATKRSASCISETCN